MIELAWRAAAARHGWTDLGGVALDGSGARSPTHIFTQPSSPEAAQSGGAVALSPRPDIECKPASRRAWLSRKTLENSAGPSRRSHETGNKVPGEITMSQVSRRTLIRASATGATAVATGGLAGILASGRAPAYAQTTTVHWLKWNDFVPAAE